MGGGGGGGDRITGCVNRGSGKRRGKDKLCE